MSENAMEVVRRVTAENRGERMEPCGIRSIIIGEDVLGEVTPQVAALMRPGSRGRVLLIVDRTPIMRRGVEAKALVERQLSAQFEVTRLVLDDGHPELHASEPVVEQAAAACRGFDAIVTVGGGTITDIGKMASARVANPPLVAVQTAASVDGYTDDVSVLLQNGVKRTVPSRWPDIVIADTVLIAEAPERLNRAGFGEINSMFVAPADWLLAKELGFDDLFSWGPVALLQEIGKDIAEWSSGLATAEFASIAALARALDIRGVATGVAGSTALLSGVEHLVSHMLDMKHAARHERIGAHGAQVGVASIVAALVWEELFEHLDAAHAQALQAPELDADKARRTIDAAFGDLDVEGALAAECWRDYERKVARWNTQRDAVDAFVRDWPQQRDRFRDLVRPAADIAAGLVAAGSPATFAQLDPAVDDELALWSVLHCGLMRNRLTAVDILTAFGVWDASVAARIIAQATALATQPVGSAA